MPLGISTSKDNTRQFEGGEHCLQRHSYENSSLPGHSGFLWDISVILIKMRDPKNHTKEENY